MGGVAVRLSDDIVSSARAKAQVYSRSVPKQIEHWARIGKIAEENPDLPYDFIQGVLEGLEEIKRGEVSTFEFRKA